MDNPEVANYLDTHPYTPVESFKTATHYPVEASSRQGYTPACHGHLRARQVPGIPWGALNSACRTFNLQPLHVL